MKLVLILSIFLVCAYSNVVTNDIKSMWQQWKQLNNKVYGSVLEEAKRLAIFTENYAKILTHNKLAQEVTLSLNNFADLTVGEFKSIYNGLIPRATPPPPAPTFDASGNPTAVDWRAKGALGPIRNQGSCGSCWTFSTSAAMEALHQIKTGQLLDLAEQNLVDCVTTSFGCYGGFPTDAFTYAAQNGIDLETNYPYAGVNGTCRFNNATAVKINTGFSTVASNNVTQLKAAVAKQPVSVAIEADEQIVQFYSSGVIKTCGGNIDHAVLIVGYGPVQGTDAWIVRNSWGPNWGDKGYFYVSTDGTANKGAGVCGILTMPSFPTA